MLIAENIWKFLWCLMPVFVHVQYKFRDRLQSLLEVGGAKIVSVSGFCSSSQVCNSCSLYNVCLFVSFFSPLMFRNL